MCSPVFATMFRKDIDVNERKAFALNILIDDVSSANYFEDFLAMISPGRQTLLNRGIFLIDF